MNKQTLGRARWVIAATALATQAGAGEFRLDSFTIDNGAVVSRGGEFTLAGTFGQPDAGALQTGLIKVEGGFWHGLPLLQTPGAPILRIRLVGDGNAIISWPLDVTGFALEHSVAMGATWSPTFRPVLTTATEHTVVVPLNGLVRCYRLKRTQP